MLEVILFYRLQWELQLGRDQNTNYLEKKLSNGISSNLRPLYNCNESHKIIYIYMFESIYLLFIYMIKAEITFPQHKKYS